MSVVWVVLWVVFSAFVLGTFAWSVRVLFLQKAAWKAYAAKAGLTYNKQKGILVSPFLKGSLGICDFGLFSDQQQTNDSRGQRYCTVLEFIINKGLGTKGVIGTQKMTAYAENMNVHQAARVEVKDWDSTWFARADSSEILGAYLTPARAEVLKKIFRMKILGGMLIFDEKMMVLRVETADPLYNLDRLEKIVKGLTTQIPSLAPGSVAAPASLPETPAAG